MKNRSLSYAVFGNKYPMGQIEIRQPLPSRMIEYLDPFVLLHHGDVIVAPEVELEQAGVGPHPHRGFAPVTFVFKGGTHHRDTRGNDSKIYAGGVQWMHAGMGVMHSERPLEHHMEIIQMWINSPAKNKMDQPAYFPLKKEEMEQFISEDQLCEVNVVSGELLGCKGKIPTLTPINSAMLHLKKGGTLSIDIPTSHNCFLYLLDGKVRIGETEVSKFNMCVFANDGDRIQFEAMEDTRALFMSGEPIGEEIVAQGPFVMNNEIQIMEAYRDFQMGKMGVLIEE